MRKLSQAEWLEGAFEALCEGGIDALRVEPLASRLGVTKGSFYHHFENRRSLHLAMLDEWERLGTAEIIDEVDEPPRDTVERLHALAGRIFASPRRVDDIEVAIRAWAIVDEVAAASVDRVDVRRVDYVAALLRECGFAGPLAKRRARMLYRVLIGEFTWRSSGGPAMSDREIDELVVLVMSDPAEHRR
ncbi:MAG: TetR/AcrR family transcriptional regulator [Acidimicrobiales bacterium]